MAHYRARFDPIGLYENEVYDSIPALLARLKAAGAVIGVATSKYHGFASRILAHFDLARYVDFVAGSEPDGTRRREDEVIAHALDRLDSGRKQRAVMIGDRHFDITGAKALGLPGIGVTWGFGSREERTAAGAAYVVDHVAELQALLLTAE